MRHVHWVSVLALLVGCGRSQLGPFVPALELSPAFVRVTAQVGEVVEPPIVTLASAGGETLDWHSASNAPWLTLDPPRGRTPADIRVYVKTTGVAPGTHRTSVRLEVPGIEGSEPADLVVELVMVAPGWTSLDGPYGGNIRSLAADPDDANHLLAGDTNGLVYVSSDGGASFTPTNGDFNSNEVRGLVFAPGGRVYAGAEAAGVLRSDNGGMDWLPTGLLNEFIDSIALDPNDADRVLASGNNIWFSSDGGVNWSSAGVPTSAWFVMPDPTGNSTFLVGGDDGVLYRGDGASFAALPTGDPRYITGFAALAGAWFSGRYEPIDGGGVVQMSSNGGTTWNDRSAGLPVSARFHLQPDGGTLWATSQAGAYRSIDQGQLFQNVALSFRPAVSPPYDFREVLPHALGTLVANEFEGVLRYTQGAGLSHVAMYSLDVHDMEVHPTTGDLVVITHQPAVFRYRPGQGWEGLGGIGLEGDYYDDMLSVTLDPRSAGSVVVGGYDTGMQYTSDAGVTWSDRPVATTWQIEDIKRVPGDPDVLWACADVSFVYRSIDNGVTWTTYPVTECSSVAPLSREVVLTGDEDGVYLLTASSGVITLIEGNPGSHFVVRTLDGSAWYAGPNAGVNRSRDNGANFTNLGLAGGWTSAIAVDPMSGNIFIGYESTLLVSTDDGASWTDARSPFPISALAFDATAGVLYAGTDLGGVYRYVP